VVDLTTQDPWVDLSHPSVEKNHEGGVQGLNHEPIWRSLVLASARSEFTVSERINHVFETCTSSLQNVPNMIADWDMQILRVPQGLHDIRQPSSL
jgi:hypothetical protein